MRSYLIALLVGCVNASLKSHIHHTLEHAKLMSSFPVTNDVHFQLKQPANDTLPTIPLIYNGTIKTSPLEGESVISANNYARRMFVSEKLKVPFVPDVYNYQFNSTTYTTNEGVFIDLNGLKYFITSTSFVDPFLFFRPPFTYYVSFNGTSVMNGVKVNVFKVNYTYFKTSVYGTLATETSLPYNPVYVKNIYSPTHTSEMTFTQFNANQETANVWDNFNTSSFKTDKTCEIPTSRAPVDKSMYIFHPTANFNIGNQDLADLKGDVLFVCSDVMMGKPPSTDHGYAQITNWTISMIPWYGQYSNCNGYGNESYCFGGSSNHVGHVAAMYIGLNEPLDGQCTANNTMGEWYSLPADGECYPGESPTFGGCVWKKTRVKTIDFTCLQKLQFESLCKQDKVSPFPSATEAFVKAFETCPDVGPTVVTI